MTPVGIVWQVYTWEEGNMALVMRRALLVEEGMGKIGTWPVLALVPEVLGNNEGLPLDKL